MATIITKNSQTASAVPAAASLSVGELAVNTADGKLYTEHTGGVVKEIIPSTVVDGGITTAKIATGAVTADKIGTGAVTTVKIADANVTGAKLENSGVTAGSYGSGSAVPVVTVDAKGRITSITTNAVAGGVTSLNGQTGAITNTTYGAIGSYIEASCETVTFVNGTRSGTQLKFFEPDAGAYVYYNAYISTGGTYRMMGGSAMSSTSPPSIQGNSYSAIWVRIS